MGVSLPQSGYIHQPRVTEPPATTLGHLHSFCRPERAVRVPARSFNVASRSFLVI
jgi:hypothetical protein